MEPTYTSTKNDLELDRYEFIDGPEVHEVIREALLNEGSNDSYRYESYPESEIEVNELGELVKDWSKAARQNNYYADSLGWRQYYDQINDLLLPFSGMQNVSLDENSFARAASEWQKQQGFSQKDCDGVIGPKTWAVMKTFISSSPPAPVVSPTPGTAPSPLNILDFNKWHAQKIVDSMNNGIIGQHFGSKEQLEKLARGEQVLNVDPQNKIVQVLPIMSHIAEQARLENYREIIFGSFIRTASDGKCTGHCAGRCIDINHIKNSFETNDSLVMVKRILKYILSLPAQYKQSLGFGMPLQGSFFGQKNLTKFKGTDISNLNDEELQQLVRQLGIVFPDNNNHLHIQVSWSATQHEVSYENFETISQAGETDLSVGLEKYVPEFEQYTLAYRLAKVRDWAYMLGFKVPDDIREKLKTRNMYVQYAHNESYSNDLNVDFYRLRIDKFPTLNGELMNPESLVKYIRLHMNDLVDTTYCDFYPYSEAIDGLVWRGNDPRGAVLKLDVRGPDNASVVVSLSKPNGWRFSTITAPNTGVHPVSGHREWFISKDSATQKYYFVIKGMDMMSSGVAGLGFPVFGEIGFGQADKLWKSMREKVIQFINANGGSATSDITYSERVEWRFVYYQYKNLLEETFGKGAGSAENSSFFG